MAAENALLHAEFLHLLQDHGGGTYVGRKNNGVDAGVFNHLELA